MSVEHGKDALILGAFGCGSYKLPVPEVVHLFRIVMTAPFLFYFEIPLVK